MSPRNDDAMDPNLNTPKRRKPGKVPGVLRGAYANVMSLERMVRDLCKESNILPPTLLKPNDPQTYSDFLRLTFVAANARAQKLPKETTTETNCSMDEVLCKALAKHFRTHPSPSNVLCNGARRKDPRNSLGKNQGGANIRGCLNGGRASVGTTHTNGTQHYESAADKRTHRAQGIDTAEAMHLPPLISPDVDIVNPSAAVNALRCSVWRTFVERAGDEIALHLLTHCSIFVPARTSFSLNAHTNGGWLQLCGTPVSLAARGRLAAQAKAKKQEQRGTTAQKDNPSVPLKQKSSSKGSGGRQRHDKKGHRKNPQLDATPSKATADTELETPEGIPGSVAAKILRRASGFVLGVMTSNPFMRMRRVQNGSRSEVDADINNATRAGTQNQNPQTDYPYDEAADVSIPEDTGIVSESIGAEEGDGSGGSGAQPKPVCVTAPPDALGKKKQRPSSWQRRKLATERAKGTGTTSEVVPETPDASGDSGEGHQASQFPGRHSVQTPVLDTTRVDDGNQNSNVHLPDSGSADSGAGWERLGLAADAPVEPQNSQDVHLIRDDSRLNTHTNSQSRIERARIATAAKIASQKEAKRLRLASSRFAAGGGLHERKPGSVSFDASSFAHKSSFARRPGLPKSHVLNSSGVGPRAARRLYAHIFGVKSSGLNKPVDARTNGGRLHDQKVFKPPRPSVRRVPKKHRNALLPLLQAMLYKQRKVVYGALLDLHCPMLRGVGGNDWKDEGAGVEEDTQDTRRAFEDDVMEDDIMDDSTVIDDILETNDNTPIDLDKTPIDITADDAVKYFDMDAIDFGDEDDAAVAVTEPSKEDGTVVSGELSLPEARSPNPPTKTGTPTPDTNEESSNQTLNKSLLASFTRPKCVGSFLWSVVTRVAPREMLGGKKSRQKIRSFIMRVVALRRFEKCTLHEAMRGIPTEEFPWLFGEAGGFKEKSYSSIESGKSNSQKDGSKKKQSYTPSRSGPATANIKRCKLLRRWIYFLIANLCVPLLRAHFYCTETETHRLRVFYYRKGVWQRLVRAHLAAMTEDTDRETKHVVVTPLRTVGGTDGVAATGSGTGTGATTTTPPSTTPPPSPYALVDPTAAKTTKNPSYKRLPKRRARQILQRHLLGFSRLRLLPKATGVRPVAMLGRPAVASFYLPTSYNGHLNGGKHKNKNKKQSKQRDTLSFRPVNAGLQNVFDVLRYESLRRPEVMGANVSNYGEVHARIAPFIRQFRKRQGVLLNAECNALTEGVGNATPATPPAQPFSTPLAGPEPCAERPYIVAADVKGAFDSIPLEALEKVAVDLVTSSEYDVQRLTRVNGGVTGGFRTKTTREAIQVGGGVEVPRTAGTGGNATATDTTTATATATVPPHSNNSSGVLIDLASPSRVHKTRITELLREHLRRNVVRSGGVYLLQKIGIPQGSVLSTLLCGVFYAHLEKAHGLGDIRGGDAGGAGVAGSIGAGTSADKTHTNRPYEKPQPVLCRWTDDLLFLSGDRVRAEGFLQSAIDGFKAYGCVLNPGKTKLNFGLSKDKGTPTNSKSVAKYVAWCGLLIDSSNLELTADYTRYAGDFVREAVTTTGRFGAGKAVGNPFATLSRRLIYYLRPKCITILYDSSVNSPLTCRVNVYQNFLLAAIKTHCFLVASSSSGGNTCMGKKSGESSSSGYLSSPNMLHAITSGVEYMERAVRRIYRKKSISKAHVKFLGLTAFLKTFQKKPTRHVETIKSLKKMLNTYQMRVAYAHLKPVIDDSRNDVFREIRF